MIDNLDLDKSEQNVCHICSGELKINDCHSQITNFPIDFEAFPLVKNCTMHKVELTKGQYLFMPKNWFHWIFTEPESLSVHHKINNINFANTDNDFYNSLKNNIPFYKKNYIECNVSYKDFISNSLEDTYRALFSTTEDCIPVQKNNLKKFFHFNTLKNIIGINFQNNFHTYIASQKVYKNNILNEFSNIENIIDKKFYNNISYEPSVWLTLDKKVNSGLHCDTTPNLIYMIEGKKTIYLFSPDSYPNLYINEYELLNTL